MSAQTRVVVSTVARMVNITKEAAANPALRKELANPYSLGPPGPGFKACQRNLRFAQYC